MYFEDEKENMRDGGALDDLEVDIDTDDKSVTWDDLLDDDANIDLQNVRRDDVLDDDSLLDSSDDLSLIGNDAVEDIRPNAQSQRANTPRKDAFDVFGGQTAPSSIAYDDIPRGDTITPDLTHRNSARRQAAIDNGDDDIYFEPRKGNKSSGFLPIFIGILVALAIVGAGVYLFMNFINSNKTASDSDASTLMNNNRPQQETPLIPDNVNQPGVDINAPADVNASNAASESDAKKDEEQKLVTFSIQNGGRINPFVPPSGFDSSKYTVTSDYEILSPPTEVPDEDFANEAKKLMEITVSGILFDNVKPSAIVNVNGTDYYVQVGDKVDECQVVAINKQYVAIKDGTNIYKAQVGENFGRKAPVDGMAKRQGSGAKQYTSATDVEVSVK